MLDLGYLLNFSGGFEEADDLRLVFEYLKDASFALIPLVAGASISYLGIESVERLIQNRN